GCPGGAPAAAAWRRAPWPCRRAPAARCRCRPRRAVAPARGRRRRHRHSLPPSGGSSRSCALARSTRRSSQASGGIGPLILGPAGATSRMRGATVRPPRPRAPPGGAVAGALRSVRYNARPPRCATPSAARAGSSAPTGRPMTASNWLHEQFEPTGSAIGFRIVRKLDEVQSPFQKIEIYESTDWGNVMLIDGAMMVTTRDNFFYHEMMSHPALFTHPDPKHVVIIGGGDCGTLREVLRHPGVETAVQCDIDEQVTRMAEKYFP